MNTRTLAARYRLGGYRAYSEAWGADHSGYVKRMQSAVTAITGEKGALDVKICQLVKFVRDGEAVWGQDRLEWLDPRL